MNWQIVAAMVGGLTVGAVGDRLVVHVTNVNVTTPEVVKTDLGQALEHDRELSRQRGEREDAAQRALAGLPPRK